MNQVTRVRPPKNPNRLRQLSVMIIAVVFFGGLVWFMTTDIFDVAWQRFFPKTARIEQTPMADRVSASKETKALTNGYVMHPPADAEPSSPEQTSNTSASTTPDSELKGMLREFLEAQKEISQDIKLLIKSHEKPSTPQTTAPPVKAETAAERKSRLKQEEQEYEERINKAKSRRSLSIDPEAPKEPHTQLHLLKTPYSLAPTTKINFLTEAKVSNEATGPFVACVSERVLDSSTHTMIVIPQISCFLMRVARTSIFGDSRLTIEAKSLTFPDGSYIKMVDASVGDREGQAGFSDQIDRHIWRVIGSVALSSVLRIGTGVNTVYGGDMVDRMTGAVASEALNRGTQEVREQFLRTDPTIITRPAYRGTLVLEDELVLTRAWTD